MVQKPQHVLPVDAIRRSTAVGQPAGVYLLDGRCHFAAYETPAAQWLAESGALLVATLRFDTDPLETAQPGHPVRRIAAGDAVARFGADAARN